MAARRARGEVTWDESMAIAAGSVSMSQEGAECEYAARQAGTLGFQASGDGIQE